MGKFSKAKRNRVPTKVAKPLKGKGKTEQKASVCVKQTRKSESFDAPPLKQTLNSQGNN